MDSRLKIGLAAVGVAATGIVATIFVAPKSGTTNEKQRHDLRTTEVTFADIVHGSVKMKRKLAEPGLV